MVLAIDIGNTNVVIGGFQEQQILFVERVSTNQNATSLELAISIKTILEIYQIQTTEIEGCIISSVVPSINHAVRKAVEKIAHCPVVLVGPGVKTGLQIAIDNPAQLGSDRRGSTSRIPAAHCHHRYGHCHNAFRHRCPAAAHRRHDRSGRGHLYECSDGKDGTAAENFPRSAKAMHRQQHSRVHEKRYSLRCRRLH